MNKYLLCILFVLVSFSVQATPVSRALASAARRIASCSAVVQQRFPLQTRFSLVQTQLERIAQATVQRRCLSHTAALAVPSSRSYRRTGVGYAAFAKAALNEQSSPDRQSAACTLRDEGIVHYVATANYIDMRKQLNEVFTLWDEGAISLELMQRLTLIGDEKRNEAIVLYMLKIIRDRPLPERTSLYTHMDTLARAILEWRDSPDNHNLEVFVPWAVRQLTQS